MSRSLLCFSVFLLFFVGACGKAKNLKICVVANPKSQSTRLGKSCGLLAKSKNSPVTCVFGSDRLDCLLSISKDGKADFGVFEGEDLYFSTQRGDSSVLVVSEIRGLRSKRFEHEFVALIRKSSNLTGIQDLKGKTFCHPGLESSQAWAPLFSEYFENRVAPMNCNKDMSVYEDRIKSTSDFFRSACKAGPWVPSPSEDVRLKTIYQNLCDLCDEGTCGFQDKYRGSGGSIICFRDGVGEVLWARYEDVKIHLKFLQGESSDLPFEDYYYLCDDGTLMPFATQEPCIWLAKPWQVLVAHPKSATKVQKIVDILQDEEHNDWEENLLHVIELYTKYPENLAVSRTPEDYLRRIPGYLSASAIAEGVCNPRRSVKLCVSSVLEKKKCDWLSKAGSSLAIRPSLECVQKKNLTSCMEDVAKGEADVVVVPPDFVHEAASKFKLKTILFEAGNLLNDSYLVSAVAKKTSGLKKLSDLKGKRICFTRKDGVGWKSAGAVLRENFLIDSQCKDPEDLTKYFGSVCVGNKGGKELACCPDMNLMENEEEKILLCLQSDGCDAAIIDANTLIQNLDGRRSTNWSSNLMLSDFEIICRHPEATDCHWMWSYPNYLMTNSQLSSSKNIEILGIFSELTKYFGKNSNKKNLMMEMFGPFHHVSNVLFRDTSTSFKLSNDWNYSNNYFDVIGACLNFSPKQLPQLNILLIIMIWNFFI